MKNLLYIVLFVVGAFTISEYVKNNKRKIRRITHRIENHLVTETNRNENYEVSNSSNTDNVDYQPVSDNQKHIDIIGLGNVDNSTLEFASKIIQDFYGYSTSIVGYESVTSDMCLNGDTLNAYKTVNILRKPNKTIYITNNNLYSESNNIRLRGFTTINGSTIIARADRSFIQETIIHEIGHTLGLDHCSNLTCVMAINNDEQDSGDFCNECKSKLNK